jgi:toxin CcdB
MARFDLHRRRGTRDWLLDVQADLLTDLPTRMVVPVLPAAEAPPALNELNPQVEIEGELHTVFPQYMTAIERRELGKPLGNLGAQGARIERALKLLHHGV